MMSLKNKITFFLFLVSSTIMLAQTPGFNYQALILSNEEIQIPGTDVTTENTPLTNEAIILRFTISTEDVIEYSEEQEVTTDQFGMVSLIVGEGNSIDSSFSDIIWDGKLKYLKVELNVLSKNEGFLLLDNQKMLQLPNTTLETVNGGGYGNVKIINSLDELTPPFNTGDLVWIKNYGSNKNTTLLIWDGNNWTPVNEDYDNEDELGLVVVPNNSSRSAKFPNPIIGDNIWNKSCNCIQVFDGTEWISITTKASNGLMLKDGNVSLGGALTEATDITTSENKTLAIKGLKIENNENNNLVLVDKNTGVLKQTSIESIKSQSKEMVVLANDGQLEFSTPLNITSSDKINVYRNGINIDFTIINNKTIKLEAEAICYKDDKIRIVQNY